MSDDQNNTPAPDAPPPSSGKKVTGSIGLSEGYRGINVVNLAPVSGVPEPGGLPPATNAPTSGGGETSVSPTVASPAESAPPPPASSQE